MWSQFSLDRLTQFHQLVNVVPRGRHQDRKHQVAVPRWQVLDLGPERVAAAHRRPRQQTDSQQPPQDTPLHPTIDSNDDVDKSGRQLSEQADEQPIPGHPVDRHWLVKLPRKQARGGRADNGHREQHREPDGCADCQGNVTKQLPRFILDEHRTDGCELLCFLVSV